MPFTDPKAAERLAALREAQGLSREGLATAIARHAADNGWLKPGGIGKVCGDTIRRIEDEDFGPSERVRLVIALYFGVPIRDIWKPKNRRQVARKKRERRGMVAV